MGGGAAAAAEAEEWSQVPLSRTRRRRRPSAGDPGPRVSELLLSLAPFTCAVRLSSGLPLDSAGESKVTDTPDAKTRPRSRSLAARLCAWKARAILWGVNHGNSKGGIPDARRLLSPCGGETPTGLLCLSCRAPLAVFEVAAPLVVSSRRRKGSPELIPAPSQCPTR